MMQCIGVGGVSSFAQSKDPKHKLFCCEIAFVVIYSLMKGKSENASIILRIRTMIMKISLS